MTFDLGLSDRKEASLGAKPSTDKGNEYQHPKAAESQYDKSYGTLLEVLSNGGALWTTDCTNLDLRRNVRNRIINLRIIMLFCI